MIAMLKYLIIVLAVVVASPAEARKSGGGFSGTGSNSKSHAVRGHTTKNGTYVAPHRSTNPNGTQRDNYGAKGNYNPHNGKTGNNYVNR
jgi:uncharacterized membrane protein